MNDDAKILTMKTLGNVKAIVAEDFSNVLWDIDEVCVFIVSNLRTFGTCNKSTSFVVQ